MVNGRGGKEVKGERGKWEGATIFGRVLDCKNV